MKKITMTVLELPPSESWSNRVSFEFLYGICVLFPSTRAEITLPSTERDWLIFEASRNRIPVACVLLCRSDPAKSTKCNFPLVTLFPFSAPLLLDSKVTVKIVCERELATLISVAPTDRFFSPIFIKLSSSSKVCTTYPDKSWTKTPIFEFSRTSNEHVGVFESKSRTSSL